MSAESREQKAALDQLMAKGERKPGGGGNDNRMNAMARVKKQATRACANHRGADLARG